MTNLLFLYLCTLGKVEHEHPPSDNRSQKGLVFVRVTGHGRTCMRGTVIGNLSPTNLKTIASGVTGVAHILTNLQVSGRYGEHPLA